MSIGDYTASRLHRTFGSLFSRNTSAIYLSLQHQVRHLSQDYKGKDGNVLMKQNSYAITFFIKPNSLFQKEKTFCLLIDGDIIYLVSPQDYYSLSIENNVVLERDIFPVGDSDPETEALALPKKPLNHVDENPTDGELAKNSDELHVSFTSAFSDGQNTYRVKGDFKKTEGGFKLEYRTQERKGLDLDKCSENILKACGKQIKICNSEIVEVVSSLTYQENSKKGHVVVDISISGDAFDPRILNIIASKAHEFALQSKLPSHLIQATEKYCHSVGLALGTSAELVVQHTPDGKYCDSGDNDQALGVEEVARKTSEFNANLDPQNVKSGGKLAMFCRVFHVRYYSAT